MNSSELRNIFLRELSCGVQSTTSASSVIKNNLNCAIWTFENFGRESLKATEHLTVCVKMRSAKHDERIVSDQKKLN